MPRISATRDRADFYYGTIVNDVRAQTGMMGTSPLTYTVPSGSRVSIMGRYDGYYVAVLPNNQIGLIPINNATPSPNQPGQQLPTPSAPQGGQTGNSSGNQVGTPSGGTTGGNQPGTPSGGTTGGQTGAPSGGTTGGNQPGTPSGGTTASAPAGDASTMIDLVNQARAQAGLKPLSNDGQLASLAGMKATDMVNNNYFSHTSPTYGDPFSMMKSYGVSYLYAGENLALNQDVQSAENALMNSPEHKANILNPNYTVIGIGIAQKSDGSRVYVQEFVGR